MKTMILAAATALAMLLFAPMAYAFDCNQKGNEIQCSTESSSEVSHGRLIISNRTKFDVGFGYSVSVSQCRRIGSRVSKGRLLLHGSSASLSLKFRDENAEFGALSRKYGPNGAAVCLHVFFDKCEQRDPSPKSISCGDVLEARYGGLSP